MAITRNYDHTALKALAKKVPGLRWQFFRPASKDKNGTSKPGFWQTLPPNKVPAWHAHMQYRVKPGQDIITPIGAVARTNTFSGVDIDKAHEDLRKHRLKKGEKPQVQETPEPLKAHTSGTLVLIRVLDVLEKWVSLDARAFSEMRNYVTYDMTLRNAEAAVAEIKEAL